MLLWLVKQPHTKECREMKECSGSCSLPSLKDFEILRLPLLVHSRTSLAMCSWGCCRQVDCMVYLRSLIRHCWQNGKEWPRKKGSRNLEKWYITILSYIIDIIRCPNSPKSPECPKLEVPVKLTTPCFSSAQKRQPCGTLQLLPGCVVYIGTYWHTKPVPEMPVSPYRRESSIKGYQGHLVCIAGWLRLRRT